MKEIATLQFRDAATGDEAVAIIRADQRLISLGVSLKKDGDVDVNLTLKDGEDLIAALQEAVLHLGGST